jgi:hypothetical protein
MMLAHERDHDELRRALQDIARNIRDFPSLTNGDQQRAAKLMESVQLELTLGGLDRSQKTDFRGMLWELLNEKELPPLIDRACLVSAHVVDSRDWLRKRGLWSISIVTGQVGAISDGPVATGDFGGIYTGMWLDKEKVALRRDRRLSTATAVHKRMEHEAELWRQLQHDNVLPIYGVIYVESNVLLVCCTIFPSSGTL